LDDKEFLQKSKDTSEKISSNGNLIKTTRAVFTRSPDAKSSAFAEHVIKEFERKALPNAEKSTLIIHAVQRVSVLMIDEMNVISFYHLLPTHMKVHVSSHVSCTLFNDNPSFSCIVA
jgi:hypothetical protein